VAGGRRAEVSETWRRLDFLNLRAMGSAMVHPADERFLALEPITRNGTCEGYTFLGWRWGNYLSSGPTCLGKFTFFVSDFLSNWSPVVRHTAYLFVIWRATHSVSFQLVVSSFMHWPFSLFKNYERKQYDGLRLLPGAFSLS
jgi:hypothetical protein